MSIKPGDLSSLGSAELVEAFVEAIRDYEAIDHIGRKNRLAKGRSRIIEAIESRDGGRASLLKPLLEHPDPRVRLEAAYAYREVDHEAFVSVLTELASLRDEIGQKARSGLEFSAGHWSSVDAAREPYRPSESVFWRSRSAPPVGLNRADLEQKLRKAFPPELAAQIIARIRPAIGLWPQRPDGSRALGSRPGGMPCVPPGWSWPTCMTEPLCFLGQINCSELAGFSSAARLPNHGLLSFFGDFDEIHGCGPNGYESPSAYYWPNPDALVLAEMPVEDFEPHPECALRFYETLDLPYFQSDAVEGMTFNEAQKDTYFEIWSQAQDQYGDPARRYGMDTSKLFGWPDLVQRELEITYNGWPLLLQLGAYENGSETQDWGPGGLIYFTISPAHLASRQLEFAQLEMQCT